MNTAFALPRTPARRLAHLESGLAASAANTPTRPAITAAVAMSSFEQLALALDRVASLIDIQDTGAAAALSHLLARLQAHADPRCTGLVVFASALGQRLQGKTLDEANLYLRQFEVPQIQLFNLLGRHVPMAALATRIANDALAQAMSGQAHPTLIDVGIGTGRQFNALLGELAATGRLPRHLTVVGIEPAAEALSQAQATLQATASELGIELRFFGFASTVEALTDADWQAIGAAVSARPAINAAFALHHIADDLSGQDQRRAVLRRLHSLNPECLVLSEPDVNHLEPRFLARFRNCFAHFGAVFAVLDGLPLSQADRDALKVGFFGREIADILGPMESQRSERHESAESWMRHLAATGFVLHTPRTALPNSSCAAVSANLCGPRAVIRAAEEPVVSIFIATPRPAMADAGSEPLLFPFQATPV